MDEIQFTPRQAASVREIAVAIATLQQRQEAYLKAILDANEVAPNSNWRVAGDLSGLVEVEAAEAQDREV